MRQGVDDTTTTTAKCVCADGELKRLFSIKNTQTMMDSLKFPGRNNKKGWTLDELCVKQFGCSRKTALDSVILVAVYMFL